MATQLAQVEVHSAEGEETPSCSYAADEYLPVSIDLVDEHLYVGNLTAACDARTLSRLGITHVLTVDSVPLPRAALDAVSTRTHKYIQLADVAKEDLIKHLPHTTEFISVAIESGGTVLVHCYFGVSRSASVVIAYVMRKYDESYDDAFRRVRSRRRFVSPNAGFVAQLRLFGRMGCRLDADDPRFRQFRLKMAGQKLKEVKILPQQYSQLVRPDPGVVCERPDPAGYRCRRCRRVVAAHHNLIPHLPKVKRPSEIAPTEPNQSADVELLSQKLERLAAAQHEEEGGLLDSHIASRSDAPDRCRLIYFVEPMAWMQGVTTSAQGKLRCPKCDTKIGSFSWIMGCRCPCGHKVAPAFYLVPSKVERSNVVQNVQLTV